MAIATRWTAPVHNILSTQSTTHKISKEHWPDINDFFLTNVDYQFDGWALALPSSSPPAGAPPQATSHHAVFVAAPELSAANESACTLPSLLPHSPRRGD
uniref:Uncharacterized protein n=1 Tax=Oryza nivara TaxID=4536 RepID=A0A0E0HW56_ORYNI